MAEYERFERDRERQRSIAAQREQKADEGVHVHIPTFLAKFDWTGWMKIAVVCFVIIGQNVFTYSALQQHNADVIQQLQSTVVELRGVVTKLSDENRDLRDMIAKQNAYIQRVDQHSVDAIERLLRLETYTYGREMKR